MKIKYQLFITHGILVVLSLMIVLINVLAYQGMESDANIINQSGKLRALSYNMVQITNQINNQEPDNVDVELAEKLQLRIDEFDSTLSMLGDKESNTAGIRHSQTILRLEMISKKWDEVYRPSYLKIIKNESRNELCEKINNEIDSYVDDINKMVTLYSLYANEKVIKALAVNGVLLLFIIIVTLYSFISTNRRIQKPMQILMKELKELSLIDEGVFEKLKSINKDEISEMTHYFNEMMYDPLTMTFNRRSGLAKLNRMLQYDNRRHTEMSICFIDINGLKMVNDDLGHKFGDELIVSSIDIIKQEIRDKDFIIRMGGDEFLIIFEGTNEADSEKVWSRINDRYQIVNEQENRPYVISISHGIVGYDNFEKSEVELLIKNADDKMYKEKRYIKEELKIKIIK